MNRALLAFLTASVLTVPAASRDERGAVYMFLVDSGGILHAASDGRIASEPRLLTLDPPTRWVRMVVREITSGQYDWAMGDKAAPVPRDADRPLPDPVPPNEIRVAFRQIGDSDHRLLVIANGYDRALAYRAYVHVNGKDQYTDVCTVPPGRHGFEHWPYAIDRITLVDLRLEPWQEGRQPRCE